MLSAKPELQRIMFRLRAGFQIVLPAAITIGLLLALVTVAPNPVAAGRPPTPTPRRARPRLRLAAVAPRPPTACPR